jgi:hypothetical protein
MKAFADEEVARLREALSEEEPRSAPGGCPNKEELWESAAGELDPTENETIILHLARCSECSLVWRLAREMIAPDRIPSSSVTPMGHRRRWQSWRRVLVPVIAATMLIGVGLSTAWLLRKNAPSPPVFRRQQDGGRILPSPRTHEIPRTGCRLEWSAGPQGTRYDLIATDGALEILCTVKGLTRPEYDLPPEKIPISTTEVFWRVTAHLPDGRTISSDTFTTMIDDAAPAQE